MDNPELSSLLASHKMVLLEFHASWCEPCKWAEPVVKEVLSHFNMAIQIHKIDIDQTPDLARHYHVLSVPTFILFRDGIEVWRMRGYDIAPVMIRSMEKFVLH